jgi:ABC-type dipeptide/oligopeptide/nickel transport system ATPase component
MNPSSHLLKVSDLAIDFSTENGLQRVVHSVNFELNRGEVLGLVGESGSGKSVTAQAILQLLGSTGMITNGHIWFEEEPLHNKSRKEMQRIRGNKIGMVFQDPMTSLNPTLRVGAQIAESLMYHENMSWKQAKSHTIELLTLVGIADPSQRFEAYPFQLSGGMRQRIMIAMALACNPLLLIADEPTTALDVTVQAQILELLKSFRKSTQMAMLLITHDLGVVAGICDRVAVMQKGTVVETADVDTLFSSPQHPYTRELLTARLG